jgi:FkbM family methyltransferase
MVEPLKNVMVHAGVKFENDKIYIPDWVTSIKLDVGVCYTASHTQDWMNSDKGALVFGFEPSPLSYRSITSKPEDRPKDFRGYMNGATLTSPHIDYNLVGERCFFMPIALSDVSTPEMMDFYCTEVMPDCSSLMKPKTSFSDIESTVKVPVYSLYDFFSLLPDDKIVDFIKIDVQGADLKVLKGARHFLTERVVYVTAEPESATYDNCSDNTDENITNYMTSINFIRISHPRTRDPTFLNKKFVDRRGVYISQFL